MNAAADVVVVGSGPVGTAVARELSDLDAALRIVVLEAGPVLGDVPGGHVKNIADPQARDRALAALSTGVRPAGATPARPGTALVGAAAMPNAATSTNVGGMGAHWTAACPRPGGAEVPDLVAADVLDAALTRAEELLAVTTKAFEAAPLTAVVQRVLGEAFDGPGRRPVGPMPVAVSVADDGTLHWTGPAVVAGDLWQRPNVTLRAGTRAVRVVMDGARATGVEVVDVATGARETLAARAVMVAGDALRTPQLLWASGVRPAALGRYLNDQPQVVLAALLDERFLPDDAEITAALGADVPRSASEAPGGGAIVPLSGVSWVPYAPDRPFHGQVMQLDASPVPLDPGETARPGQVVGLGWFCGKDISPDDRVWFDDDAPDEHGLPAIRIDYTLTTRDQASIAAATDDVRRAAAAVGRPLGEPFLLPAGSSLHYQGSTRMGAVDDGTSVCDVTARVWGTENLYVGGNNVIPTPIACNPTPTSVALGVIAARAIQRRLREEPTVAAVVAAAGEVSG